MGEVDMGSEELFVVVGLGNPGSKYIQTWHNLGFMAMEWLSQKYDLPIRLSKHKSLTAKGRILGRHVLFVCPQTFMNLSGEAVADIVRFYKIPTRNVLVIYDDLDLGVGEVRMRANGGAGTHNGMRSIIRHLGTEDFPRIRLGFGPKRGQGELADFVLSIIPKQEQEVVFKMLEKAGRGVALWLQKGMETAMNDINRKPKTGKEKSEQAIAIGQRISHEKLQETPQENSRSETQK